MATRKIEVNEDDLKKVILLLKLSKSHLQIPRDNLVLFNLWRVSGKLTDRLMRKAGFTMVTDKGRAVLRGVEEIKSKTATGKPLGTEIPEGKTPRRSRRKVK